MIFRQKSLGLCPDRLVALALHQRAKRRLVRCEVELLNLRLLLAEVTDGQSVCDGEHPGGKCVFRVVTLELAVRDDECVLQQILSEMMVLGFFVEEFVQRLLEALDQTLEGFKATSLRRDGQSPIPGPYLLAAWLSFYLELGRFWKGEAFPRDAPSRHRDDFRGKAALGQDGF